MRFLVKATMPVEAGNALVTDPNFSKRMDSIIGDIKPEAVYFTLDGGQRTIYLVVNMSESSQICSVVEPLWLSLKADVEFIPAMDQADMAKATPSILRAVQKYSTGAGTPANQGQRRTREMAGRNA